MKITQLALAALLVAGTIPAVHAGELANPVQGSVVRRYNYYTHSGTNRDRHERTFAAELQRYLSGELVPAETTVDTAEAFNTRSSRDRGTSIWDGFLKSASGGLFTFTFAFNERKYWQSCFSVWINGRQLTVDDSRVFSGHAGAYAFNVNLLPGFNSVRIALEAVDTDPLSVSYKKSGSLQPPRNIGPGDLWRDDVIEEEEW